MFLHWSIFGSQAMMLDKKSSIPVHLDGVEVRAQHFPKIFPQIWEEIILVLKY